MFQQSWGQQQPSAGGKDWNQGGGGGGGGMNWSQGGGGCKGGGGKDWNQGGGGCSSMNQGGGGKDWGKGGGGTQTWNQGGGGKDWGKGKGGGGDWGKGGGGQAWGQGGGQNLGGKGGGQDWGKGGGAGGGGKDWGKQGGAGGAVGVGGAAPGEVGPAASIKITGCVHDTVGPIVRGVYQRTGDSHGKPAYTKSAVGPDGTTVMIYFWDERDGPDASGWWIGPSIGGNMVWGHHPNRTAATPPTTGWQAPHSAAEDRTLVIAPVGSAPGGAVGGWGGAGVASGAAAGWGAAGGCGSSGGANSWQQQQEAQRQAQQAQQAQRLAAQQAQQQAQQAQRQAAQEAAKAAAEKAAEERKAKMAEQQAAMSIRKGIAKLKLAVPDTFEKLKTELEATLGTELPKCGSMQAVVKPEYDKALAAAQEKVDKMLETKRKNEEKQKELEEKRIAAKAKAKELLGELKGLVDAAVETTEALTEEVKVLPEQSLPTEARVESACASIETSHEEASAKVDAALEFIKVHTQEIKVGQPAALKLKGFGKADDKLASADEGPSLADLSRKANSAKTAVDRDGKALKTQKRKLLAKAKAILKNKEFTAVFTKYNKAKDGMMNEKEIAALAKGEYSFVVPEERLKTIIDVIAHGGKGVKVEDFRQLLAAIGSAREHALDLEKKAAREEKEAARAEAKKAQQEIIDSVNAEVKEAQTSLTELQGKVRTWAKDTKDLKSQEMLAKAEELDGEAGDVAAKIKAAQEKASEYGKDEVEDKGLDKWVKTQKNTMEKSTKMQEDQLVRVKTSVKSFKDQASKKNDAEVNVLGAKAMKRLRAHLKETNVSPADLFKELASGAESFDRSAFVACVSKLAKSEGEKEDEDFSEEDIGRGFGLLDEDKAGAVGSETFRALLQTIMKVVKDVALTPERAIADAKVMRRLEVGEAVEILEGPVEEDGLERVRVRVVSDDLEGWVSLKSNQGTAFLQAGGSTFKVLKETILTEDFDINAPASEANKVHQKTRKLKVGETVSVRQWGRKHDETGLTRMKCKALADGLIGWVTTLGNTGTKFVEMM